MDTSKHACGEIALHWQGLDSAHVDRRYFDKLNFWRDIFPSDLGDRLAGADPGQTVRTTFAKGELVPAYEASQVHDFKAVHVQRSNGSSAQTRMKTGRFYPRGILNGIAGIYPQDRRPFRYLGQCEAHDYADLNHPLARFPLTLEATLENVLGQSEEHGGRCNDIAFDVTEHGPGVQARLPELETDFLSGTPFTRKDSRDDRLFYAQPRFVNHIDDVAIEQIRNLYGRFLRPDMKILDLMSSWTSHLPDQANGLEVTGLGLNRAELDANNLLSEAVVHDLNTTPALPFEDETFDLAVCSVSVEYLTKPIEVFQNIGRVLKPGSPFVVTFSERYFPPKVIRIWTELHPFERMGLVLHYFRKAGLFTGFHTESIRGLLRPPGDKYIKLTPISDPVYAVWGYTQTRQ